MYTIETGALNGLADTVLELYSGDGVLMLASNDDIELGANLASRIVWQAPTSDWYSVVVYQWGNLIAGDDIRYTLHLQADAPTPTPTPWVTYTLGDRASCEGIGGAWTEADRRCQLFQWSTEITQTLEIAENVTLQSTLGTNHGNLIVRGTYLGFFLYNDGVIANYGRMTVGTDPLANNTIVHNYGVIIDTRFSNGGTVDNHCVGRVINPTIDAQQIINSPGDASCSATPTPVELYTVAPAQGLASAAQAVIVTGRGLRSDTELRIGDTRLRSYSLLDAGGAQARAVVPPGLAPGRYDVVATNPYSGVFTLPGGYTVIDADRPDLAITDADLWFDPQPLRQGRQANIGVNVHRSGGAQALSGVEVAFYLDDISPSNQLGVVALPPFDAGNDIVDSAFLAWTPLRVGAHTFYAVVDPAGQIAEGSETNNTAQWTLDVLAPAPTGDTIPPTVQQVTAAGGAQWATTSTVNVAVDAIDDVGVVSMYLVERVYSNAARQWTPVQQSGWIDFSPTYGLTFSPVGGARYLQAWVADAAGNISTLSQRTLINYLPPQDTLLEGQVRLYRVALRQGEELTVRVTPLSGDPDLYVWNGDGVLAGYSNAFDLSVESVTIAAAQAGTFQIEVHGYRDSSYTVSLEEGAATIAVAPSSPAAKSLPTGPAVSPVNAPAGQQALPDAPQSVEWALFLPLTLR